MHEFAARDNLTDATKRAVLSDDPKWVQRLAI
jgi:hypothetical protein